jgi:hypothetical protein
MGVNSSRLTIELSVWWGLLAAPDSVCWDEGLGLGGDGCEDALLGEALTVCAAAVFGLIEARAADLAHASV